MRLSRCEVGDHINYRKNDRWASYPFYRTLAAAEIANAPHLRDFWSPASFEFFTTICQGQTSLGRWYDHKMLAVCGLTLDEGLRYDATLRVLSLGADRQVATLEGSDWGKAIECPRRW